MNQRRNGMPSPTIRAQRMETRAQLLKRIRRTRRAAIISVAKRFLSAMLKGLSVVFIASALLLLPFSYFIMLAFGVLHSVFAAVPAIGFVAAVKVYVAVVLLKIAVGVRQSTSS